MKKSWQRCWSARLTAATACIPLVVALTGCGGPSAAQKLATEKTALNKQFSGYDVLASGQGSQTVKVNLHQFVRASHGNKVTLAFACPESFTTTGSVSFSTTSGNISLHDALCRVETYQLDGANTAFGATTKVRVSIGNSKIPWVVGAEG